MPAASPVELLQAVCHGLSDYAIRRLAAVGATQALLSKHLAQVAAIDTSIGQRFSERAVMQTLCHTEHQRLIALFMNDQQSSDEAVRSASLGLEASTSEQQNQNLNKPFLEEQQVRALEVQLAAAPPSQPKGILQDQLKRSVVAVFQSLVSPVVQQFSQLSNQEILDILQDEHRVICKTVGFSAEVVSRFCTDVDNESTQPTNQEMPVRSGRSGKGGKRTTWSKKQRDTNLKGKWIPAARSTPNTPTPKVIVVSNEAATPPSDSYEGAVQAIPCPQTPVPFTKNIGRAAFSCCKHNQESKWFP